VVNPETQNRGGGRFRANRRTRECWERDRWALLSKEGKRGIT